MASGPEVNDGGPDLFQKVMSLQADMLQKSMCLRADMLQKPTCLRADMLQKSTCLRADMLYMVMSLEQPSTNGRRTHMVHRLPVH